MIGCRWLVAPPGRRLAATPHRRLVALPCLLLGVLACQAAAPPSATSPPAAALPTSIPTRPAAVASPSSTVRLAPAPGPSGVPRPSVSAVAVPSPSAQASPSTTSTGGPLVTFETNEYGFSLPDTLPAGQVTLVMRNAGKEPHQAQLFRLNSGIGVDQFVAALQQGGEAAALALVSATGGTGALDPGALIEEVTLSLQPGTYVVVCLLLGPDGVPHFARGMLKPFQVVVGATARPPTQLSAIVDVGLRDFAFDAPDTVPTGRNRWSISNAGPQPHELQVVRLAAGKTASDVVTFFGTPVGPPPYQSVGGFQATDANGGGWLTLNLPTGDYVFYCGLPDPASGRRHMELGMLKQVSVH